jgi:hypothetical protein
MSDFPTGVGFVVMFVKSRYLLGSGLRTVAKTCRSATSDSRHADRSPREGAATQRRQYATVSSATAVVDPSRTFGNEMSRTG